MESSKLIKHLLILSFFALASVGHGSAIAASQCKGMAEAACGSASGCYWVDGYTRKDGVKVKSHCRTKAGNAKSGKKAPSANTGSSSMSAQAKKSADKKKQ